MFSKLSLTHLRYSLAFNILTILIAGALSFFLMQPLLMVIALMILSHPAQPPFITPDDGQEDDEGQPMGFTAKL